MKKCTDRLIHACRTLLVLLPAFSLAATNTVTTLTDEDDGNLHPSNGAGTSLREAIRYSTSGDSIVFSITGTNDTLTLTNTQVITKSLTIDGALSEGSPMVASSAFSENMERRVIIDAVNTFRALDIAPQQSATVALNNMVVRRGVAGGFSAPDNSGGGIRGNSLTSLLLDKTTIQDCWVSGFGGAVYSESSLEVEDAVFERNTAYSGGAFSMAENSITLITSALIASNSASTGAGLYNSFGKLDLIETELVGNAASQWGGALHMNGSDVTIDQSSFIGNSAGQFGGALFSFSSDLEVYNTTFASNSANGNAVGYLGGAYAYFGNTTMAGNEAAARILHADDGLDLEFDHVTWVNNTVDSGPEFRINNGSSALLYSSAFDHSTNMFEGPFTLNSCYSGSEPGLAVLGDYGGHTLTMPPLPGSLLIGGADDFTYMLTDQLEYTRPASNSTIGAVEYNLAAIWDRAADGQGVFFGDSWATSRSYPDEPGQFSIEINSNGNATVSVTVNPEAYSNVVYRLFSTENLGPPSWLEVGSYDGSTGLGSTNADLITESGLNYDLYFEESVNTSRFYSMRYEYVPH